jgi:hypothetical protein
MQKFIDLFYTTPAMVWQSFSLVTNAGFEARNPWLLLQLEA